MRSAARPMPPILHTVQTTSWDLTICATTWCFIRKNKVQRGHNYAIVDEVDSILIDEARTPLIISGQGEKSNDLYYKADKFARSLKMVKVASWTTNRTMTSFMTATISSMKRLNPVLLLRLVLKRLKLTLI